MTTMTGSGAAEPSAEWRAELSGLSFEEAYRRLEETVFRLEQGELPLAESETLYRQGMELAQRCQQLLAEAELRITQVGERPDGGAPGIGAVSGSVGDAGNDEWDLPPPIDPDDPSLFEDDDDDVPF